MALQIVVSQFYGSPGGDRAFHGDLLNLDAEGLEHLAQIANGEHQMILKGPEKLYYVLRFRKIADIEHRRDRRGGILRQLFNLVTGRA